MGGGGGALHFVKRQERDGRPKASPCLTCGGCHGEDFNSLYTTPCVGITGSFFFTEGLCGRDQIVWGGGVSFFVSFSFEDAFFLIRDFLTGEVQLHEILILHRCPASRMVHGGYGNHTSVFRLVLTEVEHEQRRYIAPHGKSGEKIKTIIMETLRRVRLACRR